MTPAPPPHPDPSYGPPGGHYGGDGGPRPDNFLVWAILATLCCCLPAGIVSIIYAAQVDSKYNGGDYAGARHASEQAKTWALVSLGLAVVLTALYFVAIIFGAMADQHNY